MGTHRCVECLLGADCADSPVGPRCDAVEGRCDRCLTEADCVGNPAGSVCDDVSGQCVECLTNEQCPDGQCSLETKSCVGCKTSADCLTDPNGPRCVEGICEGCVDNSDCINSPLGVVCDASGTGQCVQCLSSVDCGGQQCANKVCVGCTENVHCYGQPSTPVCNTTTSECAPCTSSAQCAGHPSGSQCSALGRCVQCTTGSNCGGGTPFCDLSTNVCVQCQDNAQCRVAGQSPVCSGGSCSACGSNADCTSHPDGPYCNTSSGKCVRCVDNTQCTTAAAPYCNPATRVCEGCTSDAACATNAAGRRCSAGSCVQCLANTDCVGNPSGSRCDTAQKRCVSGCGSNADCSGNANGPICDTNSASSTYGSCGCDEPTDCTDPSRAGCVLSGPAPAKGVCNVVNQCASDSGENSDDGPSGARFYLTEANVSGRLCYVPVTGVAAGYGLEEDWYEISVFFPIGNLYLTLDWVDAATLLDLDMYVYDSDLNPVTQATSTSKPESLSVFSVFGDTYYVRVLMWREAGASPANLVMKDYSLAAE